MLPIRPWAQRATRAGLWSMVGIGALGGVAGLARPAGRPVAQPQAAVSPAVTSDVTGFAEHAVRLWLTSTAESDAPLRAVFIDPPEPLDIEYRTDRAIAVTAIAAHSVDDDYWAVTVAAEIASGAPGDVWYFELGVVRAGDTFAAAGPPALVPAPRSETEVLPAPAALEPPDATDAITATLDGFFRALLAGRGDIARYLAPGTSIAAVSPPPFVESTIAGQATTDLGTTRARVRAEVRGTAAGDAAWVVAYEVRLALREGRWEVTALSGAPTLDGTPARQPVEADRSTSTTPPNLAAQPGA